MSQRTQVNGSHAGKVLDALGECLPPDVGAQDFFMVGAGGRQLRAQLLQPGERRFLVLDGDRGEQVVIGNLFGAGTGRLTRNDRFGRIPNRAGLRLQIGGKWRDEFLEGNKVLRRDHASGAHVHQYAGQRHCKEQERAFVR